MKKKRITTGEILLWFTSLSCIAIMLLVEVFARANVGNLNMSVEKLKYDISEQEKKNESLTMKVNELTSFDKIESVAKEMGLTYKYENIIVVED